MLRASPQEGYIIACQVVYVLRLLQQNELWEDCYSFQVN